MMPLKAHITENVKVAFAKEKNFCGTSRLIDLGSATSCFLE